MIFSLLSLTSRAQILFCIRSSLLLSLACVAILCGCNTEESTGPSGSRGPGMGLTLVYPPSGGIGLADSLEAETREASLYFLGDSESAAYENRCPLSSAETCIAAAVGSGAPDEPIILEIDRQDTLSFWRIVVEHGPLTGWTTFELGPERDEQIVAVFLTEPVAQEYGIIVYNGLAPQEGTSPPLGAWLSEYGDAALMMFPVAILNPQPLLSISMYFELNVRAQDCVAYVDPSSRLCAAGDPLDYELALEFTDDSPHPDGAVYALTITRTPESIDPGGDVLFYIVAVGETDDTALCVDPLTARFRLGDDQLEMPSRVEAPQTCNWSHIVDVQLGLSGGVCEGELVTISWNGISIAHPHVRIELLRDGTSALLIDGAAPNTGDYEWVAEPYETFTDGYTVRVTEVGPEGDGSAAESPAAFSIHPDCTIALLKPTEASSFCAGEVVPIEWVVSACCADSCVIELLHDGEPQRPIFEGPADEAPLSWTAAHIGGESTGYSIRVQEKGGSVFAESGLFSILPACGITLTWSPPAEGLCAGESVTLSWQATECCAESVAIELLLDDALCAPLDSLAADRGVFDWTVSSCGEASSPYRIRIREISEPGTGAETLSSEFGIAPACELQFSAPVPGGPYCEGDTVSICWVAGSCCAPQIHVEILQDDLPRHDLGTVGSEEECLTWVAQRWNGNNAGYRVRLSEVADAGSAVTTSPAFVIDPACTIEIRPLESDLFCTGDLVRVEWTAPSCCTDSVRIDLMLNGNPRAVIAEAVQGADEFVWEAGLFDEQTGTYSISVTELPPQGGEGASDVSSSFDVYPSCALISGDLIFEDPVCAGDEITLTWAGTYCCGDSVRIELLCDETAADTLATVGTAAGSFTWLVDLVVLEARSCSFLVTELSPEGDGAFFETAAQVTLQPACGLTLDWEAPAEPLITGDEVILTWSSTACCEPYMTIILLKDGVDCDTLATLETANEEFAWQVAACDEQSQGYRIAIREYPNAAVRDESAEFSILPGCSVQLEQPVADARFCAGAPVSIVWEVSTSCTDRWRVDLLLDGTWCKTITADTSGTAELTWTAARCEESAGPFAVLVTELLDAGDGASAQSGQFMIDPECGLTVLSPNGTETFCDGETMVIAWEAASCCSDSVFIELYQAGDFCRPIETVLATDGSFVWTAGRCGTATQDYKVRVSENTGDPDAAQDFSDESFTILGECAITDVTLEASLPICEGAPATIRWDSEGCCADDVQITLLCNGTMCQTPAERIPNTSEFLWEDVHRCAPQACEYRLRVSEWVDGRLQEAGAESEPFEIHPACTIEVISPAAGEQFCIGDDISIAWTAGVCCPPTTRIDLYRDGTYCDIIANISTETGEYLWEDATQCDGLEGSYTIRFTSSGTIWGQSGAFSIRPECSLVLTWEPLPGGHCLGDELELTWEASECCQEAVIAYLLLDGSFCGEELGQAPAIQGGMTADLDQWCGDADGYQIQISHFSASGQEARDGSDPFSIAPPCSLRVLYPDGGEVLEIGEVIDVTWETSACCDSVNRVDLYQDGTHCAQIAGPGTYYGSCSWAVAPCAGETGYQVVVTNLLGYSDMSDETFVIAGALRVCCFDDGSCEMLESYNCGHSGGTWYPDEYACDPNPCPPPGGCTGTLVHNHDSAFENGYAWSYGGVMPPYYGAFGEGYLVGDGVNVQCIALWLTQTGTYFGQTCDVYIWEGGVSGPPEAVLAVMVGFDPGAPAFWPEISQHNADIPDFFATGEITVGYWGNWPDEAAGWYCAADTDGFGGHPWTCAAPGSGYGPGWIHANEVWESTSTLGLGYVYASPARAMGTTWESIKDLSKPADVRPRN